MFDQVHVLIKQESGSTYQIVHLIPGQDILAAIFICVKDHFKTMKVNMNKVKLREFHKVCVPVRTFLGLSCGIKGNNRLEKKFQKLIKKHYDKPLPDKTSNSYATLVWVKKISVEDKLFYAVFDGKMSTNFSKTDWSWTVERFVDAIEKQMK